MSLARRIAKQAPAWGTWAPRGLVSPSGKRAPASVHTVLLNEAAGYLVQISTVATALGPVDHLWITHRSGATIRSWTDLQRIKREVLADGADRLGVEVYPPEDAVVDQANMYHLWVFPLGYALPFGLEPGAAK